MLDRIEKARIEGYKSFRDSGVFPIEERFSVVIGKNNVGKTAATEALSGQFQDHRHKSIRYEQGDGSRVTLWSSIKGPEFSELLANRHAFDLLTVGAAPTVVDELGVRWSYQRSGGFNGDPVVSFDDSLSASSAGIYSYSRHEETGILISTSARNPDNLLHQSASAFQSRVYRFAAERMALSQSVYDGNRALQPNASNLASVLHHIYNYQRSRFDLLVESILRVLPDIHAVDVPPQQSGQLVGIRLWPVSMSTDRDDLAVSLAESGTGVGQVIAILTLAIESTAPRFIIIDEPQSFLHPGAVRALFDELRIIEGIRGVRHQYVASTHSTAVIDACAADRLLRVVKEDGESRIEVVDRSDLQQMYFVLEDVGARLSDVFGADAVLWVEGQTEEDCFPMIARAIGKVPLGSTLIRSVVGTGSFDRQSKELRSQIVQIYERLTTGIAIIPPAVGFIFDREERSEKRIAELDGKPGVHLLKRRLFENYLLVPGAIQSAMAQVITIAGDATIPPTIEAIEDALAPCEARHLILGGSWHDHDKLDGSKVLNELFQSFVGHPYIKTRNGPMLVEWILEHERETLRPISDLIDTVLAKGRSPAT